MSKEENNKIGMETIETQVRLSVCMIVKNEEMNIEKALSSTRAIAFEQIVVDTGSTDKTVEISESLGAKVYHFDWINDFSAARNYSMEQALGNWILIFDADEYFRPEEAKKLATLLERIQAKQEMRERYSALSLKSVNVDDNGKPTVVFTVNHVFRNLPEMRFRGRIHEGIHVDENKVMVANDIEVIHTGYSESAHKDAGKAKRNVELLRMEVEKNPENMELKAYLANSLSIIDDEQSRAEAEVLFAEVIESGAQVNSTMKMKAYVFFINKYMSSPETLQECEKMCKQALAEFPDSLDYSYFLAATLNRKGDYREALELLTACESRLADADAIRGSLLVSVNPVILYSQLILAAGGIGDFEQVVFHSIKALTIDKSRQSILGPLIATLLKHEISEDELVELLSNIYDLRESGDVQFIAKTAGEYGAAAFADAISRFAC
jgi:glycosyltransferase involved in cell wall biosynthesis